MGRHLALTETAIRGDTAALFDWWQDVTFTDIHTMGPNGVFDAAKVEHLFVVLHGLELAPQWPLAQAVA